MQIEEGVNLDDFRTPWTFLMYLTATEAAAELGVSRSTLYAYVSRRGIRSIPVEGSKERLYWKSDVLAARRLKGRPTRVETSPPPVSSISLIGETALYYRGQDVVDLAATESVERVAALLWDVPEQQIFTARLPTIPPLARDVLRLMRECSVADRANAALPLIEEANPRSYDFSHIGLAATGADVLRCVSAVAFGDEVLSDEPMDLYVARRLALDDASQTFVRQILILSAEHGFEPSSVAVRGAASIGVSPYRSVAAGLLLLTGRRTQIGRIDGLARLVEEIEAIGPETVIVGRLKEGERIPGFGLSLHADGDPRARAVITTMEALWPNDEGLRRLKRAIAIVYDALGLRPDYALALQYAAKRLTPNAGTSLFMLGRCIGWIAHAIEQYRSGEAERPASLYAGPLPAKAGEG